MRNGFAHVILRWYAWEGFFHGFGQARGNCLDGLTLSEIKNDYSCVCVCTLVWCVYVAVIIDLIELASLRSTSPVEFIKKNDDKRMCKNCKEKVFFAHKNEETNYDGKFQMRLFHFLHAFPSPLFSLRMISKGEKKIWEWMDRLQSHRSSFFAFTASEEKISILCMKNIFFIVTGWQLSISIFFW